MRGRERPSLRSIRMTAGGSIFCCPATHRRWAGKRAGASSRRIGAADGPHPRAGAARAAHPAAGAVGPIGKAACLWARGSVAAPFGPRETMNIAEFAIGFWHPFGPHGRETPEQIIQRKQGEIAINGWTLWSFQWRRPEVLGAWCRELSAALSVVVFCSDSTGADDPADAVSSVDTIDCRSYRLAGKDAWQSLPAGVRVPHPFRTGRSQASAFVVQRIMHPVEPFTRPPVEWLSEGQWRQRPVPTRGEYLIRPGGTVRMRRVRAVLKLRAPYLALVSANAAEQPVSPAADLAPCSRSDRRR